MVGLASAFGFLMVADPVVAARAFTHVFVGLTAALLIQKENPHYVASGSGPAGHAGLEALIVIPFGSDVYTWGVVVVWERPFIIWLMRPSVLFWFALLVWRGWTFWVVPEKAE